MVYKFKMLQRQYGLCQNRKIYFKVKHLQGPFFIIPSIEVHFRFRFLSLLCTQQATLVHSWWKDNHYSIGLLQYETNISMHFPDCVTFEVRMNIMVKEPTIPVFNTVFSKSPSDPHICMFPAKLFKKHMNVGESVCVGRGASGWVLLLYKVSYCCVKTIHSVTKLLD